MAKDIGSDREDRSQGQGEKVKIKYPKGVRSKGQAKIAVSFPEALFDEIIKMAKKENKTFNAMIVELSRCGKLCLDESDQHEPKKAA